MTTRIRRLLLQLFWQSVSLSLGALILGMPDWMLLAFPEILIVTGCMYIYMVILEALGGTR